jgi:gliding motility-associated-like protein
LNDLLFLHKIYTVKQLFFISLLFFSTYSFAQLEIELTSYTLPVYPSDGDTLSVCRDSMIIFKAYVTKDGAQVTGAEYFWDFDDNNKPFGTDLDSVTNVYDEGGGYRVKLFVQKDADKWFSILPVKVAMQANYSKTKLNIPEEQSGICKGSTAEINGVAYPVLWKDEPQYTLFEDPYAFFEYNDEYSAVLTFDEFGLDSVYKSGAIDSVGLNILHADMGDLEIKLSCENGNSVILKNFDATNHALLGDTLTNLSYTYYWSELSGIQTMNSITTEQIISSNAYLPDESFDNLIGCPLNGNWTLEITDNQELDSGYVYQWSIVFDEDILPPVWSFKDTLLTFKEINSIIYGTYWTGINVGGSQVYKLSDTIIVNSSGSPDIYGPNKYSLFVINNWGCPQDTFIILNVEEPSFTSDPQGGVAKLTVQFENTTTWASDLFWELGDRTEVSDSISFIHEYQEKGSYEVILYATDNQGCIDTDTLTIEVSVEPSKLSNIPNMFSPNDDGINDRYYFTEDKLAGMDEFIISIYNRWGEKVFEETNMQQMIDEGWDGRNFLGLRLSPGVYYYVIKAIGKDDVIYKHVKNPDKVSTNQNEVIISAETRGTIHLFR